MLLITRFALGFGALGCLALTALATWYSGHALGGEGSQSGPVFAWFGVAFVVLVA